MANSESIRHLLIGREAVPGVLAATMTQFPFLAATHTPKLAIIQPKELRGTRVYENVGMTGVRSSEVKVKMQGYYDLLGWVLCTAFNSGTSVADATTAFDWTFKSGAGSVPSNSLEFSYGVGTAIEIWEKALSSYVEQIDFTFTAEKLVEVDITWVSNFATVVGTPTLPGFSIANYLHPFGQSGGQSVTVNGGGFSKLISAKVSLKNNRTPLYVMQTSNDPGRFIEGQVQCSFDFVADYTADAASFYNNYRTNALPGAIVLQCQDLVNGIGTAGAAKPTFNLTIPIPRITSASLTPDSKGNTTSAIKGVAEYDTVSSSVCTAFLTNMIANYNGS